MSTPSRANLRNYVGARYALALSSGTAALHLALIHLGVGPGDEVLVSDLTFAASANPVVYLHAQPTFIDCERISWNMDPALLEETLAARAQVGSPAQGRDSDPSLRPERGLDPILAAVRMYDVPLIEDAAEALGATYKDRSPGTLGKAGIYSFNGNKIITTSGGGMLVSDDADLIEHARKLATQARDPAPHYQHSEIGYNYRLSNVLAGIGRGQLAVLEDRVQARRRNFDFYVQHLGDLPGLDLCPKPHGGVTRAGSRSSRWMQRSLGPTARRSGWRLRPKISSLARSGNPCTCSLSSRAVRSSAVQSPRICLPTASVCPPVPP